MLIALLSGGYAVADTLAGGILRIEHETADRASAEQAAEELLAALDETKDRLPAGDRPIHVVLCATQRVFERYAGPYTQPGVLGVAVGNSDLIAVKSPGLAPGGTDWTGTLRHELVHILLERNVNTAQLPRWLNEGIAMTVSREHRWSSSLRVGQMYVQGRLIKPRELEWVFLAPGHEMEFGDAYAQALSMTRFLMDELGEDRFWEVVGALDTLSFNQALKTHAATSEADLFEAWKASLWKVALVFSVVSGFSIFQMMAFLTILAYLRKRRRGRKRLREWAEEERLDEGPPFMTARELEDREGPHPWEADQDEEYP